jgi:SEC-C motif domain protein
MNCPCETALTYDLCCRPFIDGTKLPATAEQLMRSRYTAYTRADVPYLKKTLAPESRADFDAASTKQWAEQSTWKGLKILSTENGLSTDKKGVVEFTAVYEAEGQTIEHHEVSKFRKDESGQWLFIEGDSHTHAEGEEHHHHEPKKPIVREAPKLGRNDPCTCGSGKKFKKCHGA